MYRNSIIYGCSSRLVFTPPSPPATAGQVLKGGWFGNKNNKL
jgi:hypothetical protein